MNKKIYAIIVFMVMVLLSSITYAETDFSIRPNTIDHWTFDTDADGSLGNFSGNVAGGITQVTGKIGNAYKYDGTSAYINLTPTYAGDSGTWTLVFVANCTGTDTKMIIGSDINAKRSWTLGVGNNKLYFECGTGHFSTATICDGNLKHFAVIVNTTAKTTSYYINGVFDSTAGYSTTIPSQPITYTTIGKRPYVGAEGYFSEIIDEMSLFSNALNTSEIEQAYNCTMLENTHLEDCGVPSIENFTITASSYIYGDTLNIFNATLNGVYYSTTTGTIDTGILDNTTTLYNITIISKYHYPRTYLNYNLSINPLNAVLNTTYYKLNVYAYNALNVSEQFSTYTVNATRLGNTISNTTTTSVLTLNLTKNTIHNITIDVLQYQLASALVNVSDIYTNYTFYLYGEQSFNISIYNEKTNTYITDNNITIEFISDSATYNYTTDTGKLYAELLVPDSYAIRYYGDTYGRTRTYFLDLSPRSHNELTFYLIKDSNSSDVSTTVYDQNTLNTITGAYIYLQRYFIDDNNYKTVAMYLSDTSGKAYFDIELKNEKYKFIIDKPFNTRRLSSEPNYIEASTLNFYISLTGNYADEFFNEQGIVSNIEFSSSSNTFSATFTDSGLLSEQFCLYLKTYGIYGSEIINSTCTTANSGTLLIKGIVNDTTNYAVLTSKISGVDTTINTGWQTIYSDQLDLDTYGIFLTIILIMLLVFLVQFNYVILFIGVLGLVFARLLNIINLEWVTILGLLFISLLIGIIIRISRR